MFLWMTNLTLIHPMASISSLVSSFLDAAFFVETLVLFRDVAVP